MGRMDFAISPHGVSNTLSVSHRAASLANMPSTIGRYVIGMAIIRATLRT